MMLTIDQFMFAVFAMFIAFLSANAIATKYELLDLQRQIDNLHIKRIEHEAIHRIENTEAAND